MSGVKSSAGSTLRAWARLAMFPNLAPVPPPSTRATMSTERPARSPNSCWVQPRTAADVRPLARQTGGEGHHVVEARRGCGARPFRFPAPVLRRRVGGGDGRYLRLLLHP